MFEFLARHRRLPANVGDNAAVLATRGLLGGATSVLSFRAGGFNLLVR